MSYSRERTEKTEKIGRMHRECGMPTRRFASARTRLIIHTEQVPGRGKHRGSGTVRRDGAMPQPRAARVRRSTRPTEQGAAAPPDSIGRIGVGAACCDAPRRHAGTQRLPLVETDDGPPEADR
ncbi:hypothetical protein [Burkholderia pseudomultivorans]|uniref:hypothetical protein n=1 Tax=Burkholderia pseudomultivorans TaxID=1207504 RepID=UPI0012D99550|nr:hypothetical protein [Burkholderia pseudomultivorans]